MESETGKLFIGGISWDTNEDRLREYFRTFGEVIEAIIMKDRTTGRARGFGFVIFSDPAVAEKVVSQKHVIDGRCVEAKKAVPYDQQILSKNTNTILDSPSPSRTKKIFVGGLPSTVTEVDFKKYFEQFGTIADVVVMYDHNTQRHRGFGFITYASEEAVDKALMKTFHDLNGKMVEVKRAVPKELSPGPKMQSPVGGYGGYNIGLGRANNFLEGYTHGYNPSLIGSYGMGVGMGMRMDGRFGQPGSGRYSLPSFGPGYGIGLNFEPGMSPSYGGMSSFGNNPGYGRVTNPFLSGNSSRYTSPARYDGSNGNSWSVFSSSARDLLGNTSLDYTTNSSSPSSYMAPGNGNIGGFGNGNLNWGGSSPPPMSTLGSGASYSNGFVGYGTGESTFNLGANSFVRNSGNGFQFKDTVSGIVLEHGSGGTKVFAIKFIEVCVKLFSSGTGDCELPFVEGEGDRTLGFLLDILQSASTNCGFFTIAMINSLSAIARSRPLHYNRILSSLLAIDPKFETLRGGHAPSLRYAFKACIVGFLRCTHPLMVESREKLSRVLRATNPGDATEQIIRQMEKMSKSMERVSCDVRVSKDDLPSGQMSTCEDMIKKRPIAEANDTPFFDGFPAKRAHYLTPVISSQSDQFASDIQDQVASNEFSSDTSVTDSNLTPAEKMITMIGALLGEGDRGVKSLELLLSNIHADLLADIVIETMKHLPSGPPGPSCRHINLSINSHATSATISSQRSPDSATSVQASALSSLITSVAADASGISLSTSDMPSSHTLLTDSKRDPRRDCHYLDPRRAAEPVDQHSLPLNLEINNEMLSNVSYSLSRPLPASELIMKVEEAPVCLLPNKESVLSESSVELLTDHPKSKESLDVWDGVTEAELSLEVPQTSNSALPVIQDLDEEVSASNQLDISENEGVDDMLESDHCSSTVSTASVSDDICHDFPVLPLYIDLTDDQKKKLCKLTVTRIIEGYQQVRATGHGQARLPLLARLVAQADADDHIIMLLQKHIILDYHHQKGHELAMNVLYYLHAVMISVPDEYTSSVATKNYEKFLLAIAKALLDSMPASDKSFSRLLGEAPFLTESALRLLEDLCQSRYYACNGKDTCDGDRVTQGLGAVWSLILGRPPNRQACLNIALKCAVYSLDEVRAKAIRLVANKLYLLKYASEDIERYATSMLLSVVNQQEIASQETSISSSQNTEPGASESESTKGIHADDQSDCTISFSHAQQQTSLFFALCTKRPSLLKVIFDIYGRAPKSVKQSVHRHLPILVRTLGSSHSELLQILSDPPEGCENLIMLVLRIMTEESTPTDELVSVVKHLYETKLKDAAILIPMLSSLSKDEVLPIFPRLVDLPLDKFQAALARILQGSAHTGPALTPVEALVAVHEIIPERDGVALKKITDACTACFEQRTVFTQHVLERSLSHLVDKVPLPLLLMRTVIQAIDAFPTMVDFVMGLLSKLVNKQIWRMPKLWVGFLKCASQTQPHSFQVLLQLPPPHLESALSRYTNLRGPLVAFVNQSNIKSSLSRHTLRVLGLVNEQQQQSARSYLPATLHASDTSSSIHGSSLR